jgi:hypothetical protein
MKNILELKASKKLGADHIIRAVLLDIGSPPPSEPEKQPVVLCLPPGDIKMGCNIIGKHLHIDPAEKGRVIWITSKKDGACYVSYFDDEKKHFLTIRDGVHFDFRDLDPKVKMNNPKDRLPYLAKHFQECWDAALEAMSGRPVVDITPIATALWIETKAGVTVPPPVPMSEPKGEVATPTPDPAPAPAADPPPGKPPEELPEVKEVHIKAAYEEYSKMDYSKICELAASALKYSGTNGVALAKREALIKLVDELAASKEPKAWFDVYDSVWQPADESIQKILDDGIAMCFEKKPDISESHAHRITCLNYWTLIKANEKI